MNDLKHAFAEKLLGIKAIKLQPNEPFQWASGWNSPIYTDNRLVLSYPEVRAFVKTELTHAVIANFPEATAVAGVATGAIAMGMAVADLLQLPYAYVRPKPKDHGTKNQIEGRLPEGSKVVVIEDLISTGSSSLKAVDALRKAGFEVVGMVASYTYGFPVAEQAFKEADLKLVTLGDYEIPYPQQAVYDLLSDLGNIDKVKERIPQDKVEDFSFDHDSISIKTQMGAVKLVIVNREAPKEIKFETAESPLPFNFWIQILPVTETTSKMKLTIKADINPFMATMVKKPLQQGIEKIADALQNIKYQ